MNVNVDVHVNVDVDVNANEKNNVLAARMTFSWKMAASPLNSCAHPRKVEQGACAIASFTVGPFPVPPNTHNPKP